MTSWKAFLAVFLAALAFGVATAFSAKITPAIKSYALWRASWVLGRGLPALILNNVAVVFLTLYGGVLFSLAEVKSYETFPRRAYNFLDELSSPLHWAFSLFDGRILALRNPAKSCFFIGVSFPVMVFFLNVFLFFALTASATEKLSSYVAYIALIEFSCILAAAHRALSHAQENFRAYEENNIRELEGVLWPYVKSPKNLILFLTLTALLCATGAVEIRAMTA